MTFELDKQEAEKLSEILTEYLQDLRMEVADTDSLVYREKLKETEAFLKDLIHRLGGED